jgi:hypothetical protein
MTYPGSLSLFLIKLQYDTTYSIMGPRGSIVAKELSYKPEGRGFDTRLGDFFFKFT